MRRELLAAFVVAVLGVIAGCDNYASDGVARSCSDSFSEGDPCEGSFTCNLDCRFTTDGWGYGCVGGRIFRSENDCGLVRDAGRPVAFSCTGPLVDGGPCAGDFACNTDCPWDGMPAFVCTSSRLVRVSDPCADAGAPDADVSIEDAASDADVSIEDAGAEVDAFDGGAA